MSEELDERIARQLYREHQERANFRPLAGDVRPADLDQAYRAQTCFQALCREAGAGEPVGYKIALTSLAMQRMVGLDHPLYGVVFATRVHAAPARLQVADFQHLGVECEVAVRLARPLPAPDGRCDRATVAAATASLAPAFELVEDRNADYGRIDAVSLIADNCWNGGIVLGAELTDWLDFDLTAAVAELHVNGAKVAEGKAGDALGHPFEAVAWLARALAARGERLEADMIVMTGSVVRTVFPAAGDRLRYTMAGLGTVELTLE